ncbi:MAG: cysteine desulfurase-like protein [Acidimicrobiales bacterium]
MSYDVEAVRRHFPSLNEGAAHFDGPGGSQVPDVVGDVVRATLIGAISNRGTSTASARRADKIVLDARAAMSDVLGAEPTGVVFGRSMTQLTYDFSRTIAKSWVAGDEILVSRLDHDANIRPWLQAAESAGVTARWIDFDPTTGELDIASLRELLNGRTKLVAVTAASNLIGTRPDVAEVAQLVREVGALSFVDGVHLAPHAPVNVAALGVDFFVCSPYKFLGPHCGVLAARPDLLRTLAPDKLLPSSNTVPERFELGTLPFELLAGTNAAVDFIADLSGRPGTRRERLLASMSDVEDHEQRLFNQLESRLTELDGLTLFGHAKLRTPTLLFSIEGISSSQVSEQLAAFGVNAPAGNFYALEVARRLGLGDDGAVRAGLAPYTNQHDVDRLIDAVETIARNR